MALTKEIRTHQVNRQTVIAEQINFNILDHKGRMVGIAVQQGTADFEETDIKTGFGCWVKPAGHYFWANCQSTRNSKIYGATQMDKFFTTSAEQLAWVNKRINESAKNALKNFPEI